MQDKRNTPDKSFLVTISEKSAISDDDIYEAMKEIPGYLDITTSDFKELYNHSYRHALDRLINSVRAGDIMTKEVVTVEISTPLHEVAESMATHGVSGVPVLNDTGSVSGIISERDFLGNMGAEEASFMAIVASCLRGKGCAALNIRKGSAKDIMTSPVISVGKNACLGEVASLLTQNKINRVPVIDELGKKLLGILTRSDLVKAHVFG